MSDKKSVLYNIQTVNCCANCEFHSNYSDWMYCVKNDIDVKMYNICPLYYAMIKFQEDKFPVPIG